MSQDFAKDFGKNRDFTWKQGVYVCMYVCVCVCVCMYVFVREKEISRE